MLKRRLLNFTLKRKLNRPSGTHYVNWELSDPVTSGVKPSEQKVSHEEDSFFDLGSALEDELMTVEEPFQALEGVDESTCRNNDRF